MKVTSFSFSLGLSLVLYVCVCNKYAVCWNSFPKREKSDNNKNRVRKKGKRAKSQHVKATQNI